MRDDFKNSQIIPHGLLKPAFTADMFESVNQKIPIQPYAT